MSGMKLQQTPDELLYGTGTIIYIENLQINNTWPTEHERPEIRRKSLIPGKGEINDAETVGLYNLGNTCYMNSAL
jgi:ubiquitin C-terminal hydrolase